MGREECEIARPRVGNIDLSRWITRVVERVRRARVDHYLGLPDLQQ